MLKFIAINEHSNGTISVSSFSASSKKEADSLCEKVKEISKGKIKSFVIFSSNEGKVMMRKIFAAVGRSNREEEQNN